FWGVDEMLLCGLAAGAKGAVGSTYNYAAPVYRRLIEAFERGNLDEARDWQLKSVEMIRRILSAGGLAAQKAVMQLIDQDCGPTRLPVTPLSKDETERMAGRLREIGYFEWGQ
ncbi:MAG: dihydrodipicolinate synthase family protein, partial [Planctomycetes bacterium]|nr:dihydrodipicolinate synthase family protein [Planctomycetota bacterium]